MWVCCSVVSVPEANRGAVSHNLQRRTPQQQAESLACLTSTGDLLVSSKNPQAALLARRVALNGR